LGIIVGASESGGANMLKRMKIVNPMQQQKEEAEKEAIEEHHAILFKLGANNYKYGKLIKDMKNDVIHKKDPFPKTIGAACHIFQQQNTICNDDVTQYTLWHCRTNQRYEKQHTGNISRASNTRICTWVQDEGNISRWATQTNTTNN